MTTQTWQDEVSAFRREKDRLFAGPHSPLPAHERHAFRGLPYYPLDPRYRSVGELGPADGGTLDVPRTGGDTVVYERIGRVQLALPVGRIALTAFRTGNEERAGELFVPFKDATSGTETYGGGRYLEIHEQQDGRYLVDLNLAYHPFCVYSEDYSCPLPPRENWLAVPVRAGERLAPGA